MIQKIRVCSQCCKDETEVEFNPSGTNLCRECTLKRYHKRAKEKNAYGKKERKHLTGERLTR